MSVHQALDHPGGLHVDEDRVVVRAVREFEDTDDPHLERIDARDVEDTLRRRDHIVARSGTERFRRPGAEHALAQHGEVAAGNDLQAAEVEVVERGADDRMAPSPETHVHRNRRPEVGFGHPRRLGVAGECRVIRAEVEGVEDELERTTLRPDEQRGGVGARGELTGALIDEHPQADRQVHDKRDRADQRNRLPAVVREVAPGHIDNLPHGPPPLPVSMSTRLLTDPHPRARRALACGSLRTRGTG